MQQPDFEIVEPEPKLPPALQLAQDAVAQTRAYHQSYQTRQQQLSDASPPTLTYAGQSQGQPLLRTPEGSVFRAGLRDSNGALRPGVVDVVSASGIVRVGGMPRVRPDEVQAESVETPNIAVFIERQDGLTGDMSVYVKENAYTLFLLDSYTRPVDGDVLGFVSALYYDRTTILVQVRIRYTTTAPQYVSNTVYVLKNRGTTLEFETDQTMNTPPAPFVYPSSLNLYTPLLLDNVGTRPAYEPYTFTELLSGSGSVLGDGTSSMVFLDGESTANEDYRPGFRTLLNTIRVGVARGLANSYSTMPFAQRQTVQLTSADLAVWGLDMDSTIYPGSLAATPQTIAEFMAAPGIDHQVFFDDFGYQYNLQYIRGFTDERV